MKTLLFHQSENYLVALFVYPIAILVLDQESGSVLKSTQQTNSLMQSPADIALSPSSNTMYLVACDNYKATLFTFNLRDQSPTSLTGYGYTNSGNVYMVPYAIYLGKNNDLYIGGENSRIPMHGMTETLIKMNLNTDGSRDLEWFVSPGVKTAGGQVV